MSEGLSSSSSQGGPTAEGYSISGSDGDEECSKRGKSSEKLLKIKHLPGFHTGFFLLGKGGIRLGPKLSSSFSSLAVHFSYCK